MAYARHQTFYIRDKWISKGLKAINQNSNFFYEKLAFEKLGLGKNMFESLRFWLTATGLIEEAGKKEHQLTELGRLIFENDRLLQYNDTLSILHYKLVRNQENQSTVFQWFFNSYIETKTQKDELIEAFTFWVSNNESKVIAEKSLKNDINCIIQFYSKVADNEDPEDNLYSPFSRLNLVKVHKSGEEHNTIIKNSPVVIDIGITALYFVLLSYAEENNTKMINLNDVLKERYMWGRVFNMSRQTIIEALNQLTNYTRYPVEYVRTNNLDYIRLPEVKPMDYLRSEYETLGGGNL